MDPWICCWICFGAAASAAAVCIYYVRIGGALCAPLYVNDKIQTAAAEAAAEAAAAAPAANPVAAESVPG